MKIRIALADDIEALDELIRLSVHGLSAGDYSSRQIELALEAAWGIDRQLILDQTYYILELDGKMAACGGWSFRNTLFGNDNESARDETRIDPSIGAAKIRAFFVHPDYARQGLGASLLKHCEHQALKDGYQKFELMATLPGQRLYEKYGYEAQSAEEYPLSDGLTILFVKMVKCMDGS